jgi:HEAT repeat protein
MKQLQLFALLFSCLTAAAQAQPGNNEEPKRLSRIDSLEAIAKALKSLDKPRSSTEGQLSPGSLPPGWGTIRQYLAYDYYLNSRDSIELLARTKAAVDKDLLDLARSDKRFQVRYRARNILARRGNAEVLPLLEEMQTNKDADVRFLGWDSYSVALAAGKPGQPMDIGRCIRLYQGEKDKVIRDRIEGLFGAEKAKEAVKPLIESVKRGQHEIGAIWALGEIGDPSAVPMIVEDFARSGNRHFHLQALGKLATPQAVDFIIKHLDEYGAVEALCQTKSDRALPALQEHLAKLKSAKGPSYNLYGAATRIAIVRMGHKDPREELLRIAEDMNASHWERADAFRALRDYDTKVYKKRILDIFSTESDTDVRRFCIWLLDDSNLPGIKEAMMDYALVIEPNSMGALATEGYLLESLNKRLGTSFWEMQDMREYIKELRKGRQQK